MFYPFLKVKGKKRHDRGGRKTIAFRPSIVFKACIYVELLAFESFLGGGGIKEEEEGEVRVRRRRSLET